MAHIDISNPYCPALQRMLIACAEKLQIDLKCGATYAYISGPRCKSLAEIEVVRLLGGHLVRQTNYPEYALSRELAMCYAKVGICANYASGLQFQVTAKEVLTNIQ